MRIGCLRWVSAGLVTLAFSLAAAYFIQDKEKLVLNPATRKNLSGAFVTLSDGVTHYELFGPEAGPVVVLVHGFSVASYAWERNVPDLVQAGFRVLSYDLYGRGYSDRPDVAYTLDLFVRQLDELLTALKIDRPVNLAGISLGGYIAAGYVHQHADRVARLALFAPQSDPMGSDARLRWVTLPGFGDYLFAVYILPAVLVDAEDEFKQYGIPKTDWHARYLDMMQYQGFRRALLSTLRNMPGDPFIEYRAVGQTSIPVLLLWGDQDDTVPIQNSSRLQQAIPQVEFHTLPGAGHPSIYQAPQLVDPLLIQFFSR